MKTRAIIDTMRPRNEDAYDITKNSVFVIDGASGLTDRRFMPRGQDVAWMSQWWRKFLVANIDNMEKTLQEILVDGIVQFNFAYNNFTKVSNLKKHELLSASIGIIRLRADILEVFVLGDAEVTLEMNDGNIETITDDTVEYFDKGVINLMKSNPNRELFIVRSGFTKEELELLIENRSKMNTPEGYYILSTDKEAVENGLYMEYPIENIKSCMMATDGIVPLSDRYSRKELLNEVKRRPLEHILEELREIEEIYVNSREVRRLKHHDDVTLVYVTF